jgi:succinate-semialdehyde dehydrogenase/glutarate-semialdehyde dehydrogenase
VNVLRVGPGVDELNDVGALVEHLVGYVYTRDTARGQRMIDLIDTGMMGLNVGVVSNAAGPFGGVKQSGLGREGGTEGIYEYLETKYTLMPNPYEK